MAHSDRKTQRQRGTRTCGWGGAQKHRNKGSRGGVGNGGSKNQKWTHFVKFHPDHFGRKGFKRPQSTVSHDTVTNVGWISSNISKLVEEGFAKEKNGVYTLDITQTEYTKLLGTGNVNIKIEITVDKCSEKARQKIEAAGGKVESCDSDEEFVESVDEESDEGEAEQAGD